MGSEVSLSKGELSHFRKKIFILISVENMYVFNRGSLIIFCQHHQHPAAGTVLLVMGKDAPVGKERGED